MALKCNPLKHLEASRCISFASTHAVESVRAAGGRAAAATCSKATRASALIQGSPVEAPRSSRVETPEEGDGEVISHLVERLKNNANIRGRPKGWKNKVLLLEIDV